MRSEQIKQDMLQLFKRLIKLAGSLLYYVGWMILNGLRKAVGKRGPGTCIVLYYHQIRPEERNKFERQLDTLEQLARVIPADMRHLSHGHHVVVSFDDGLESVLKHALPEVIRRRIPVTLFIPSGYIGQFPDWEEFKGGAGNHESVITEGQIKDLPKDLITIGSHSVSHRDLRTLGAQDLQRELKESKEYLEKLIGRPVTLFSFPYGKYNARVVEVARQTGYERVFSILPQLANPLDYVVGRVAVTPSDWPLEFRFKLLGAYRWEAPITGLKHRIRLPKD